MIGRKRTAANHLKLKQQKGRSLTTTNQLTVKMKGTNVVRQRNNKGNLNKKIKLISECTSSQTAMWKKTAARSNYENNTGLFFQSMSGGGFLNCVIAGINKFNRKKRYKFQLIECKASLLLLNSIHAMNISTIVLCIWLFS